MATELLGIAGMTVQLKLTKFDKRLIGRNRAETVFNLFGRKGTIGPHQGKSISFRRFESIYSGAGAGVSPTALTEGTPPAPIQGTFSEVLATVSQYGRALLAVLKTIKFTQLPMPRFAPA